MVDCLKLLEESWQELQKWTLDGRFDPETEADIQCFLYHCLVERFGKARGFHAEYKYEEGGGRTDLVIGDKVFVEIKYILRSGARTDASWKNRKQDAEKAIESLRDCLAKKRSATGVLAIFAESYKKEDELWYDNVKENCQKSGIMMIKAWKKKA